MLWLSSLPPGSRASSPVWVRAIIPALLAAAAVLTSLSVACFAGVFVGTMAQPTVRITAEQVNSPQFHGQPVRAVGKLLAIDQSSGAVQLQLAGPEGARAQSRDAPPGVGRACVPPRENKARARC